jgi:carbamoyltransferase
MQILGLHSAGHDTGVCLWRDGRLVFAMETERLSRKRHDHDVEVALRAARAHPEFRSEDIDLVALSTPFRQALVQVHDAESAVAAIKGRALHYESTCELLGRETPCVVVAHEASHAALALHYAGYADRTSILVNEGHGFFSRNALFAYTSGKLTLDDVDSLPWYGTGFGWSALGVVLGMGLSPSVAGKMMAMGGFGMRTPRALQALHDVDPRISELDPDRRAALAAKLRTAADLDGGFQRQAELVNALQYLFSEAVLNRVQQHLRLHRSRTVALGGGCGLNIVANSYAREVLKLPVHVAPACNDAGQALGVAIYALLFLLKQTPEDFSVYSNALYSEDNSIDGVLDQYEVAAAPYDPAVVARLLAEGEVVAFFQGAAELGPRALGNRSLLASPVVKGMKVKVSERMKRREWFRPLAPVMRTETFTRLFPESQTSPFMLFNYDIRGLRIPEATHADGSGRIQTVSRQDNSRLNILLEEFEKCCGVPALINTSLNSGGRPIAQTARDVLRDFWESGVNHFVFEDITVSRI